LQKDKNKSIIKTAYILIIINLKKMIESEKWYSLKEVHKKKILPMLKSEYLIRTWVKAKKIKSVMVGKGRGLRYSIKGNWLIQFIAKWEAGDFHS